MTGGDRGQRLIFQVGPCIPSLVAVSLSIERKSGRDLMWHGEGRQVEKGRLARVIAVAGSTSGAPWVFVFFLPGQGRHQGKQHRKDNGEMKGCKTIQLKAVTMKTYLRQCWCLRSQSRSRSRCSGCSARTLQNRKTCCRVGVEDSMRA
jgi:hypothetical protein